MFPGEHLDGVDEIDPMLGKRRPPLRLVPLEDRGILVHRLTRTLVNTFCIYILLGSVQPLGLRRPSA